MTAKPFLQEAVLSLRQNRFLAYVRQAAYASLIDEVSATPKPGLVDRSDSGAHKDMDYRTFRLSAEAIIPYLEEMARLSLTFSGSHEELFSLLRPVGMEAEKAMFEATGGVNTHKGMIFSMGLTAAAAGSIFAESEQEQGAAEKRPDTGQQEARRPDAGTKELPLQCTGEAILSRCSDLCLSPIEREFCQIKAASVRQPPRTHGEYLFVTYGCRGIRGEAAAGFPSIRNISLPALRAMAHGFISDQEYKPAREYPPAAPDRNSDALWNDICLQTLLRLMAEVDDTNVLYRTDYKALSYVREQARQLLHLGGSFTEDGKQGLRRANLDFIEKNISPGGCADLLAITLFIWRLEQYRY